MSARASSLCALLVSGLVAGSGCDVSLRVGELPSTVGSPDDGQFVTPEQPAVTPLTWRRRAPAVPCDVHALAEVRSDLVYAGCNGGRVYRFDGVDARVALDTEDESVFSLLWASGENDIWAAAQTSFAKGAPSKLYRSTGASFDLVATETERIVAIAGVDAKNVWVATESRILRVSVSASGAVSLVSSYSAPSGAFRGCAFASPSAGWCVGTGGLAVAFDGAAWTPMTNLPWTASAEVMGVEIGPFPTKVPYFFFGEPITHPNGDHECRLAKLASGTLTAYSAAIPCFPDFSPARRRTSSITAAFDTYLLISPAAQYGGALAFDVKDDAVRALCGPILSFAVGASTTRVGGQDGLLGTLVGSGGKQLALTNTNGSNLAFRDLSVATDDGVAWARVEDVTTCGTPSEQIVRFTSDQWRTTPAPDGVRSGRGLAAISAEQAYTVDIVTGAMLESKGGAWREGPPYEGGWSLSAKRAGDVWVGGVNDDFGRYDGATVQGVKPRGARRQVEEILAVGDDVWLVAQGVTKGDTNVRLVRAVGAQRGATFTLEEWDMGYERVHLSAADPTHLFRSGAPAAMWDGAKWNDLPFDARAVWARTNDDVYFAQGGNIAQWDGKRLEVVYRGALTIRAIDGARDHAFAVGFGGLTVELARWPRDPG